MIYKPNTKHLMPNSSIVLISMYKKEQFLSNNFYI